MPCTTLLVGRKATYDGSTMMARNEDSPSGQFTPKKFIVVNPKDQPRHYQSVLSKFSIDLKEEPMRYTAMPNALPDEGFWGEAGINEANVAMSETETITSNYRVLGADPLVKEGIGEEDMLLLVLPYIHSAREGVKRLGDLLARYGTYEMNGIGFQDAQEVWWLETIGGHHWIARKVPDDRYVVMPNQQGIDSFDMEDALGKQKEHMCSPDLAEFIRDHHLDLMPSAAGRASSLKKDRAFNARLAFGSHDDADHTYNTPRAWFMLRYLNPRTYLWDGPDADFTPEDDDLPWSLIPERKITPEDVKYALSGHYQGTPYDCYGRYGDSSLRGKYRAIGINRNNFLALTQLRPDVDKERMAIEWIAESSNVFNAFVPFYANVTKTPAYFAETGKEPDTHQFYWANRLIAALADAHYGRCASIIERYQNSVGAQAHALLEQFDKASYQGSVQTFLEKCNDTIAAMAQKETDDCLGKVLYEASCGMKNAYARSDS
ncbi:MAG: C69 family dipeptidase [Acidaminococcus sp.]|nr:C69 family dipeptidase [Acidaminococcus sp.]MCI2100243.1 C69 family dipeptidase [Acidaminococcus sp.]MCI2114563.1 C69 family dipeptidase [Acidaminococcus sp.]MCI2116540.1 C69 family dipeptidase [Acidaminococcus sp.]